MPFEFTKGSVTMDFAQTVGGGGISLADYHHYEDLASGTSHTPTAKAMCYLCAELYTRSTDTLNGNEVHVEFWDTAGWVNGHSYYDATANIYQDNSQNLRVYNADALAFKISLTGVLWTAGYTDYHHYENLASGASYTPTAQSMVTYYRFSNGLTSKAIRFWDGGSWEGAHKNAIEDGGKVVHQDTSQNLQMHNFGSLWKISLTGVIWS